MPIVSLKSCFVLILFLYSDVVKSYRKVEIKELVYFSNLLLHFRNK